MRAKKTEDENELAGLLFELANADRLTLLLKIASDKQRMSSLSSTIAASVPECSRHLSRLTDSGLAHKDTAGFYEATPVGRTILKLLPGLETVVKYRTYFLTHDLSVLPLEFIQRIGALSEAEHISHFSDVLDRIKRTISEAREYSNLMVDKPIFVGKEEGLAAGPNSPSARFIFGETISPKLLASVKASYPSSTIALTEKVEIALGVTERNAGIIFPSDGRLDFGNGFFGNSQTFRKWCSDLFEFCWSKLERIRSPSSISNPSTT